MELTFCVTGQNSSGRYEILFGNHEYSIPFFKEVMEKIIRQLIARPGRTRMKRPNHIDGLIGPRRCIAFAA